MPVISLFFSRYYLSF